MSETYTDRLDALLNHFPVHARLFHSGTLCGTSDFSASGEGGQMHLLKAGAMEIIHPGRPPLQIRESSLLFYPRPLARRFIADAECGAELACADISFEGGNDNPLAHALPDVVCLPLAQIVGAEAMLELLFAEAFGDSCGRRTVVDRLFEIVLIQVLRNLMENGQIRGGMLAGLGHPKLRKALIAMHEQPAQDWSLDTLAGIAGMSRSVFANTFRHTLGNTPGNYLQSWRVRLTQKALRKGKSLKQIAIEVGYTSEAALSRAFKAQCGVTPREWRSGE